MMLAIAQQPIARRAVTNLSGVLLLRCCCRMRSSVSGSDLGLGLAAAASKKAPTEGAALFLKSKPDLSGLGPSADPGLELPGAPSPGQKRKLPSSFAGSREVMKKAEESYQTRPPLKYGGEILYATTEAQCKQVCQSLAESLSALSVPIHGVTRPSPAEKGKAVAEGGSSSSSSSSGGGVTADDGKECAAPHSWCVMGLDVEWRVIRLKGQQQRRIATLQLSTKDVAAVFQMNKIRCIPEPLRSLLERQDIIKVGVGVKADCTKLSRDWPLKSMTARGTSSKKALQASPKTKAAKGKPEAKAASTARAYSSSAPAEAVSEAAVPGPGPVPVPVEALGSGSDRSITPELSPEPGEFCRITSILDLKEVIGAACAGTADSKRTRGTLQAFCEEWLQQPLGKPSHIRLGNWEAWPLSEDELGYAATDAWAGVQIFEAARARNQALVDELMILTATGQMGTTSPHPAECPPKRSASNKRSPKENARIAAEKEKRKAAALTAEAVERPNRSSEHVFPQLHYVEQLTKSKLEAHRLLMEEGLTLESIAEMQAIKVSTLQSYLADVVAAGLSYSLEAIGIDEESVAVVDAAAAEVGLHFMNVHERLSANSSSLTIPDIRIVIAHLRRQRQHH